MDEWQGDEEETAVRPTVPPPGEEQTVVRPMAPAFQEEQTIVLSGMKSPTSSPDETIVMHAAPGHLAYLIEASGPRAASVHRLSKDTNIGRDTTVNTIIVDDQAASRIHAKIRLDGDQFVLYDLASENGTWIQRVDVPRRKIESPFPLEEGDLVEIGRQKFLFMRVASD